MNVSQVILIILMGIGLTLAGAMSGLMMADFRTVKVMVPTPGPGCDDKAPKLSKPIERVRV